MSLSCDSTNVDHTKTVVAAVGDSITVGATCNTWRGGFVKILQDVLGKCFPPAVCICERVEHYTKLPQPRSSSFQPFLPLRGPLRLALTERHQAHPLAAARLSQVPISTMCATAASVGMMLFAKVQHCLSVAHIIACPHRHRHAPTSVLQLRRSKHLVGLECPK